MIQNGIIYIFKNKKYENLGLRKGNLLKLIAQNFLSQASAVHELWTSRCSRCF